MKRILIFLIALWWLQTPCAAADLTTEMAEQLNVAEAQDALPDTVRNMLSDYDWLTGSGLENILETMKETIIQAIAEQFSTAWKPAIQTLVITILCSVLTTFGNGQQLSFPVIIAGCAAIVFLTLSDTTSFFHDSVQAINQLYNFSTALLPCLAGAAAFTGATVSSGVKYTAAALFMNLLLNFCNTFLVPLITLYLICIIGNTVFDQKILGAVSNLIRWLCTRVLTGCVIIFTAYLSVSGLISTAGDTLTARVAKTALSTSLPVVGNIISNTAATLVAGASVLRNCIGVFGMLAVLGIMVVPFASMGIRYLLFKGIGELAEMFPYHHFSALIKGIAGAFGMLIAVLGSGFIMVFMILISFMNLSGGI